jgi:SnoaL-like protein
MVDRPDSSRERCAPPGGRSILKLMSTDDESKLIQEAADRSAILDAVATYSLATDERDWERVGALFTADAVWDYTALETGGTHHGPGAIVATIRAMMTTVRLSQHTNSTHLVRLLGDEAEHTCYFLAHLEGQSDTDLMTIAGRYDDRFVRASGGWLIARRTITSLWTSGSLFSTPPEG